MSGFIDWITNLFRQVKCWTIVLPWERAVRIRLGKHVRILEPGFHVRIPIIDEVRVYNNRLRICSFPCITVTTRDGKTVTAAGLVGFRIVDPLASLMTLREPETTCSALAMSAVAKFILASRFETLKASEVECVAVAAITSAAPGIIFDFVRLTDFASVRTYRLLQDSWRPGTATEIHS